jgi:peroxiredoxin
VPTEPPSSGLELPPDLPVPEDDGAADHLIGAVLPRVPLPSTDGDTVDLAERSSGRPLVVFAYPRTGRPGEDPLPGWDDVPGARGCTPEACSFRDLAAEFAERGAELFGLSTQDTDYQREAVQRLHLSYPLLSDAGFALAETLRLPTFDLAGQRFLRRLTFVARNGRIERVQYPVFPPDRAAADALALLD